MKFKMLPLLGRFRVGRSASGKAIKTLDVARRTFENLLIRFKLIPANSIELPLLLRELETHPSWSLDGLLNMNQSVMFVRAAPPRYENGYHELKELLLRAYRSDQPFLALRVGDGELSFLNGMDFGNVVVGRRHFNELHSQAKRTMFLNGLGDADVVGISPFWAFRDQFLRENGLLGKGTAVEYFYALSSLGWFCDNMPSLGLIGATPKLDLINKLLGYRQYVDYVGRSEFVSFIGTPQLFAGDQTPALVESIASQVADSPARAFLVGMGIAKLGVLPQVARRTGKMLIDVGVGIDALAGVVDPLRPYFGNWTNFQIDDARHYESIDFCGVGGFRNRVILPPNDFVHR